MAKDMNKIVFTLILSLTVNCMGAEDGKDCKCFEEFEPEKEQDHWLCRGIKNHRIFECGEEKPPSCVCTEHGKEVTLDIGETNCFVQGKIFENVNCSPKEIWDVYYRNHPTRRVYS